MNKQKNYEINGLLKAGISEVQKPVYILITNQMNNLKDVATKMNQYLTTIRPFAPFIWVICCQQTLMLEIDQVKQLLNQMTKNVQIQQIQRIAKLIIVSDFLQLQQIAKVIPGQWQSVLANKLYQVQKLNQLSDHNIELSQYQLEFLARINNIYQEEQQFFGRELQDYPLAASGIPEFLEEILKYYERNDDYLKTQGVFRISGSVELEEKLIQQMSLRNYAAINDYPPDVISTALKNILTNLKSPIFPFEMYDILKETQINTSREKLLEMFQVFFAYMPQVNRRTTKRIAELLFHVASYEKENLVSILVMQMGLTNLSIVFAPCFLRAENNSFSDLMGAKTVVSHFMTLVQNVDFFLTEFKFGRNSYAQRQNGQLY